MVLLYYKIWLLSDVFVSAGGGRFLVDSNPMAVFVGWFAE